MADFAAVFVIAVTIVGNVAAYVMPVAPLMKIALFFALTYNINIRLHPERLQGTPEGKAPDLSWPGREVWKWLGIITATHSSYFIINDYGALLYAKANISVAFYLEALVAIASFLLSLAYLFTINRS